MRHKRGLDGKSPRSAGSCRPSGARLSHRDSGIGEGHDKEVAGSRRLKGDLKSKSKAHLQSTAGKKPGMEPGRFTVIDGEPEGEAN